MKRFLGFFGILLTVVLVLFLVAACTPELYSAPANNTGANCDDLPKVRKAFDACVDSGIALHRCEPISYALGRLRDSCIAN